jgi:LacI family transcriptional regulator/LacI family repressor for deo operon, udp, cdd, tsx, nupC, and nupG
MLCIDNDETDYRYDSVGFDPRTANRTAMKYLLSRGYRRIALIGGSSPNDPFDDSIRLSIYREAHASAGLPFQQAYVKDCGWDLDLCAVQTRELLSLEAPPDAIIAGSDSLATAILGTIHAMGLRCPDDVGVIGFNNINLCAHMVPPLTTINVPTREIGVAAAQRMMELVRGNGGGIRKVLFPTELIVRSSVRE